MTVLRVADFLGTADGQAPDQCQVCHETLVGMSIHFVYGDETPWATYYPCGCTLYGDGTASCVPVGQEYHRPTNLRGGHN